MSETNNSNVGAFSENPELMESAAAYLNKAISQISEATTIILGLPKGLEGCENISTIPERLTNIYNMVCLAKQAILDSISAIDSVESDNLHIIERMLKEGEELEVSILAGIWGVDTKGKTKREIINEMAENAGLSTKLTPEKFLEAAFQYHNNTLDYQYSYGAGLPETSFEDIINNPDKKMCCATLITAALYLSGYAKDGSIVSPWDENVFQPHGVMATHKAVIGYGSQKITDKDDLQPGDILFFKTASPEEFGHVEIYVCQDENGNTFVLQAGTNEGIQIKDAMSKNGPYWDVVSKWEAYRLPETSSRELDGKSDEDMLDEVLDITLNTQQGFTKGTSSD